eukprot:5505861-Pyramimonas_sp.AAC.1
MPSAHPDPRSWHGRVCVTQPEVWNGATPLYMAVQGGHLQAVRLLLQRPDTDVNEPNSVSAPHPSTLLGGSLSPGWSSVRFP